MKEQKSEKALVVSDWRVVLAIGTLGLHGEVDTDRLGGLPLEALFNGTYVQPEAVSVLEGVYGGHYVDWRLCRDNGEAAALHAAGATVQALDGLHMAGIAIKGARVTDDRGLFGYAADRAWIDMKDVTDVVEDFLRTPVLPETITADDFR